MEFLAGRIFMLHKSNMFINYLKIAGRNYARNKIYTATNVLGLALGMCACIAIYSITHFEFSFDRHHKGYDRIYRLMSDNTESTGNVTHFGRVPVSVGQAAINGFAGVEMGTVIVPYDVKITVANGDRPAAVFESRLSSTHFITTVIAGTTYFNLFNYRLLAGNVNNLAAPFNVILTESRARQYFGTGNLDQMLGRAIVYGDSLIFSVAGIVADPLENTDLAFTDFISKSSVETTGLNAWAFLKLSKAIKASSVDALLKQIPKLPGEQGIARSLRLEPITDMHFNEDVVENTIRTAHKSALYSLRGIAVFILLLAIINFINLSTALSIQRAKEVGVRKVLGSSRTALITQFLTESFILTLMAFALALLPVKPLLYAFRDFIPVGITFHLFDPAILIFLVSTLIVTALLAGLYPAKVLSSHLPVNALKAGRTAGGKEHWLVRKGLIVFQFAASLIFITGSIVMTNQLHFTMLKDLGFSHRAIIIAEVPGGTGYQKISLLAKTIEQVPGVERAAMQWVPPMTDNTRGMKLKFSLADDKDFWVTQIAGNEDFIPLYNIKLLAGRNLLREDSVRELVINESLSKMMGDAVPSASIGKILYWNDRPYPVSGVVADFHTKSLHTPVTPLCIINRADRFSAIAVKFESTVNNTETMQAGISAIGQKFKQVYPEGNFSYRFFDESIAMLYDSDRKTATLINVSTGAAIFISCVGLFGLALFTSQKRAKEISIRKILGANVINIAVMLCKEFIMLAMIAFAIATPVAWYLTHQWLQEFAYRTNIGVWIFALSGLIAIVIAILSISPQAIKAAIVNPVKTLRNE